MENNALLNAKGVLITDVMIIMEIVLIIIVQINFMTLENVMNLAGKIVGTKENAIYSQENVLHAKEIIGVKIVKKNVQMDVNLMEELIVVL